jgi:hypothetical protein
MASEDVLLVGHNIAAFDISQLLGWFQDPEIRSSLFRLLAEDRICDTYLREKLLAIAHNYHDYCPILRSKNGLFSLASCVKRHFSVDLSEKKKGPDIWRVNYHKLDGTPLSEWPVEAAEYPMEDAEWALHLALAQAPLGGATYTDHMDPITTNAGGVVDETRQCRASLALYLMSAWGVISDPITVEEWSEELDAEIEEVVLGARRLGFVREDGTQNKKILRTLVQQDYEDRGKIVPMTDPSGRYPDGQISTSGETLISCSTPELRAWGASKALTERNMYLTPARIGTYAVVPYNYDPIKNTGRTSSWGANNQNPPRKGRFRECTIPRAGKVFCSSDYSAAELCALAQIHLWVFGSSDLALTINNGIDPHCYLASFLAGVPFDEFMSWYNDKDHPLWYASKYVYRQCAKIGNFGVPGGLGAKTLVTYAKGMGVDLYEIALKVDALSDTPDLSSTDDDAERLQIATVYARQVIAAWNSAISEGSPYMRRVGDAVEYGGEFTFNQFVSGRNRGGCNYTSGCNTGFQGLVADGAKEAMWRVAVLCYLPPKQSAELLSGAAWVHPEKISEWAEALYGVRPVMFIHDEIIAEGPEDDAHIWAEALSAVMVEGIKIYIPDVNITAEPALMRRWYKGAEPAFGEDGTLVPWEPT